MRRKHRSETQWQKIINNWQDSGLSVSQFCREKKVPTSAFYRWKMKFQQQKEPEQNPFVQVPWPKSKVTKLELSLATGHTFRFDETTGMEVIVSVLAAFKEVGLC